MMNEFLKLERLMFHVLHRLGWDTRRHDSSPFRDRTRADLLYWFRYHDYMIMDTRSSLMMERYLSPLSDVLFVMSKATEYILSILKLNRSLFGSVHTRHGGMGFWNLYHWESGISRRVFLPFDQSDIEATFSFMITLVKIHD